MSALIKITIIVALVLSIIIPFGVFLIGERNRGRFKTALGVNIFFFFGILVVATIAMFAAPAPAAAAAETAAASGSDFSTGIAYIAAALATGMSCIGGGIAVANAASAALGALSENESIFGKSLIFVAMAEGVALYGLIISFMILGKV